MTIFGIDVSHHQGAQPDMSRARSEGIEFAFIKATEGATFVDPRFDENVAEARAAGLLVAAYHYVRSNSSVAAQVANVRRVVPLDVPVIPDVETNSGVLPLTRQLVDELRDVGYRVPLLYLPRWYWQQLGSPSLVGLPPLWSSRYPDNVVDDLRDEFARVPSHYWNGYGGLSVAVLQFTSSARIAGYAPLDANAYRGTREQLAVRLGYQKEKNVNHLILAQLKDSDEIWVGDGLTRRHVADTLELGGLQFWIQQRGGDSTIHEDWEDLRVLGAPVAADVDELQARPIADVDEAALAAELEARGVVGVTAAEIKSIIQAVFTDAGTDDE